MAINVVGFDNVQFVDFNPDPASGVPNDLFLITGVALIQPFTGTTGNQGGWTRDTCSFDVPTPDGQPFLFSGGDVSASALVVPATVQNVGSEDIGFGVDNVSAVVSEPVNMQKQRKVALAFSENLWYIDCMSKQHTTSRQAEGQKETRERIIAAASKVLAEKGYDATTLREISREAEAAPGLVHYYFGGKDELLVEVLQAAGRRFHQRMEHLVQHAPADRSLEAVLTQLRERVDLEPEVYRLRYESFSLGLHNSVIEPRVRERLAQRRNEIGSVIAKVLENSERTEGAKHSSLDPTILAALLLSIFDGLALQKIMDPTFDLEASYHLLAQMLHGLLGSFGGERSL